MFLWQEEDRCLHVKANNKLLSTSYLIYCKSRIWTWNLWNIFVFLLRWHIRCCLLLAYLKRKLFFCYLWILDFKSRNSGFCFSYNDKTFRDYLLEWCLFLKFCDQKDWWHNKKQAKLSNTIIELFRDRNNTFFHSSSSSGDSNASSLKSRRTQDATSSSSSSYENKSNNEICLHFGRDCIGLSLTPA